MSPCESSLPVSPESEPRAKKCSESKEIKKKKANHRRLTSITSEPHLHSKKMTKDESTTSLASSSTSRKQIRYNFLLNNLLGENAKLHKSASEKPTSFRKRSPELKSPYQRSKMKDENLKPEPDSRPQAPHTTKHHSFRKMDFKANQTLSFGP